MSKRYPEFPDEWNDANFTVMRQFYFSSTPDVEFLIHLVKTNLRDGGNDGVLKARLLGILDSYFLRLNEKFWLQRKYPNTYMFIILWRRIHDWFHLTFNTKKYKRNVHMCQIINEILNEQEK